MKNLNINSEDPQELKECLLVDDESFFEVSVDDLIARLQGIRAKALSRGCYDIHVTVDKETESYYGGGGYIRVEVAISASRLELPLEVDARIAAWKKRQEAETANRLSEEQKERETYEKLKAKFDDE